MAPALNCFLLSRSPPELWETPPRYVLDRTPVNLHGQKHVVSMSWKREHFLMLGYRTLEECYAR